MIQDKTIIIGGGVSGMETALQLSAAGGSSIIVEFSDELGGIAVDVPRYSDWIKGQIEKINNDLNITVMTSTTPKKIRGTAGSFSVDLQTGETLCEETASAIVIAAGISVTFPWDLLPSGPSGTIMTIMDLVYRNGSLLEPALPGWIVFVLGFSDYSSPFSVEIALREALELKHKFKRDVIFITDTIRFNDGFVPHLYQQCRESGIIFVKSVQPPQFLFESSVRRFQVTDPAMSVSAEPAVLQGEAAMIVFEPRYLPVSLKHLFWSPHDPDTDENGFYVSPNLNEHPVKTNRLGVYIAGSIMGLKNIESCRMDAAMVAAAVLYPEERNLAAVVDEDKCAACLTCVRLCPHGAVTVESTAHISPEACDGCGICVAECPAQAITLESSVGTSSEQPAEAGAVHRGVVLYCCDGSTYNAFQKALKLELMNDELLLVKRLPCTGYLQIVEVLETFKQGVSGIFVAACQDGNCAHVDGNRKAERRVRRIQSILKSLNMDPGRIKMSRFASHMGSKLAQEIKAFCREMNAPGEPT